MPFCTSCGAETKKDANFCTGCGRSLRREPAMQKAESTGDARAEFLERLRVMEPKVSCAYCLHRLPKNVCGVRESPNYNRTIRHEDQCASFGNNPAQLDYIRAIFMDEYAGKYGLDERAVAAGFQRAIGSGLPTDDELAARFKIGKWLALWVQNVKDIRKRAAMAETQEAVASMEAASALDRQGGFGFFAEPANRYWLRNLDMLYVMHGTLVSIERGSGGITSDAAAVEYWEKKFELWKYLPSCPFLFTLKEAGYSYSRLGRKEEASKCFRSLLTAAPVDPFDQNGSEAGLREEAKAALEYLYEKA